MLPSEPDVSQQIQKQTQRKEKSRKEVLRTLDLVSYQHGFFKA